MDWCWQVNDHMEMWSLWLNKTGILLCSTRVSPIVWLHHLDFNESPGEKAGRELLKDAVCGFKQILEVTPDKTTAVQPLTTHLTNYPSKTSKICWALLEM